MIGNIFMIIITGFTVYFIYNDSEYWFVWIGLGLFFACIVGICKQDCHDSKYKTYGYRNKKQPWKPKD